MGVSEKEALIELGALHGINMKFGKGESSKIIKKVKVANRVGVIIEFYCQKCGNKETISASKLLASPYEVKCFKCGNIMTMGAF